ncbi:MAG: hypothetical protein GY718_02855 [Lentisphaerae bacterium]|nr:hypothetical protein [Lentisphaerota bacterium]
MPKDLEVKKDGLISLRVNGEAAITGRSGPLSNEDRIFFTTFKEETAGEATDFNCYDGGKDDATKGKLVIESFYIHTSTGTTRGYLEGYCHSSYAKAFDNVTNASQYTFSIGGLNESQSPSTEKGDKNVWFKTLDFKTDPLEIKVDNEESVRFEPISNGDLAKVTISDFTVVNTSDVNVAYAKWKGSPQVMTFASN